MRTSAKYFTVYFRRTNKFDSSVAYLILYITDDDIMKQLWVAYGATARKTTRAITIFLPSAHSRKDAYIALTLIFAFLKYITRAQ